MLSSSFNFGLAELNDFNIEVSPHCFQQHSNLDFFSDFYTGFSSHKMIEHYQDHQQNSHAFACHSSMDVPRFQYQDSLSGITCFGQSLPSFLETYTSSSNSSTVDFQSPQTLFSSQPIAMAATTEPSSFCDLYSNHYQDRSFQSFEKRDLAYGMLDFDNSSSESYSGPPQLYQDKTTGNQHYKDFIKMTSSNNDIKLEE